MSHASYVSVGGSTEGGRSRDSHSQTTDKDDDENMNVDSEPGHSVIKSVGPTYSGGVPTSSGPSGGFFGLCIPSDPTKRALVFDDETGGDKPMFDPEALDISVPSTTMSFSPLVKMSPARSQFVQPSSVQTPIVRLPIGGRRRADIDWRPDLAHKSPGFRNSAVVRTPGFPETDHPTTPPRRTGSALRVETPAPGTPLTPVIPLVSSSVARALIPHTPLVKEVRPGREQRGMDSPDSRLFDTPPPTEQTQYSFQELRDLGIEKRHGVEVSHSPIVKKLHRFVHFHIPPNDSDFPASADLNTRIKWLQTRFEQYIQTT
eukprot:652429_1